MNDHVTPAAMAFSFLVTVVLLVIVAWTERRAR